MLKFSKLELAELKQWDEDDTRFYLVFDTEIENYNGNGENYNLSLVTTVNLHEDGWTVEDGLEISETSVWYNKERLDEDYGIYYDYIDNTYLNISDKFVTYGDLQKSVMLGVEKSLEELGDELLETLKEYESDKDDDLKSALEDLE